MIEIIAVKKESHNLIGNYKHLAIKSSNNSSNNNNQSQTSNTNKWVINLSNTSLTSAQEPLLAKGTHFAVAHKILLMKITMQLLNPFVKNIKNRMQRNLGLT